MLKAGTGYNMRLIGTDATRAGDRRILGVPLHVSPYVAEGTIWGITRDRTFIVVRDDVRIEVDRSVYFTSDRVAVKATMLVRFGFLHQAALVAHHAA